MSKKEEALFTGQVKINGVDWPVAMNLNTITDAEEAMGDSISIFATGLSRTRHIRALIWSALREGSRVTSSAKKADPRITLENVGAMLSTNNMGKAMSDVMGLLRKYRSDNAEGMLAPFVPTPAVVINAAFEAVNPYGKVVIDLGCGDGSVLEAAVREGAKKVIGYEADADRWKLSRANLILLKEELGTEVAFDIQKGQLTGADVSQADIVFIYLLQDSNQVIKNWLGSKMQPGAMLISHDFTMEGWIEHQKVEVFEGARKHTLTVYMIGENTPVSVDDTAGALTPTAPVANAS